MTANRPQIIPNLILLRCLRGFGVYHGRAGRCSRLPAVHLQASERRLCHSLLLFGLLHPGRHLERHKEGEGGAGRLLRARLIRHQTPDEPFSSIFLQQLPVELDERFWRRNGTSFPSVVSQRISPDKIARVLSGASSPSKTASPAAKRPSIVANATRKLMQGWPLEGETIAFRIEQKGQ